MQIGFIGLGKMGLEMAARAASDGHALIGCDTCEAACERAAKRGIKVAASMQEMVNALEKPARNHYKYHYQRAFRAVKGRRYGYRRWKF